MNDFITDVEHQYEVYCKVAEDHGFIDLNAKKNGFRCTTKSNEFNAGWVAFVGAVAAVRDEQKDKIDHLTTMNQRYIGKMQEQQDQIAELEKSIQKMKLDHCAYKKGIRKVIKALRGDDDLNLSS